jgi:hypothetical protein
MKDYIYNPNDGWNEQVLSIYLENGCLVVEKHKPDFKGGGHPKNTGLGVYFLPQPERYYREYWQAVNGEIKLLKTTEANISPKKITWEEDAE